MGRWESSAMPVRLEITDMTWEVGWGGVAVTVAVISTREAVSTSRDRL
jgi:hypothetical protein